MAEVHVHKSRLIYKATDFLIISVVDASGSPVNMEESGTQFGIAIARTNHPDEPQILQKILGDPDIELNDSNPSEATIEFGPDDYSDGKLKPRLGGYWYTVWYQSPIDEHNWAIANGPLEIQPVVAIDFSE